MGFDVCIVYTYTITELRMLCIGISFLNIEANKSVGLNFVLMQVLTLFAFSLCRLYSLRYVSEQFDADVDGNDLER